MKHVVIPETPGQPRLLPFYLAAEEWVARELPRDEYFFTWIVDPTVIFGRNQLIDAEVDLEYCRRHGIRTFRRRSGGGCVFADRNNIMMSYITWRTDVASTFARYTAMVEEILRKLGLDASASGRNDVLIGSRKVSGNAFYHVPGRSIAHGTMLYSTDIGHMLHAITPSRSKLESKQVQSVASHITTIKKHLPALSIEDFRAHIIADICDDEPIVLTAGHIADIETIEQEYYRPEWIYGRKGSAQRPRVRVEGAGEFMVDMELDSDHRISHVNLGGDFFLLSDLDSTLLKRLEGVPYEREAIAEALRDTDAGDVISGLTTEAFIGLLVNN
ncbi:MAG: lipoyltransferase [Muribaculaceae bacterium]|nr:lipoyltransferase [Muribaculaceae bacterium]